MIGTVTERRTLLISWYAVLAVLPLLWAYRAAEGSQEFVDDDGEIRDTLLSAPVLLLFWALAVDALVRPLWRSALVAVCGGALALGALGGSLRWGYGRIRRVPGVLEPDFWGQASALALRGVTLPGPARPST